MLSEVNSDEKMLVVGHGVIFSSFLCNGVREPIASIGRSFINPMYLKNIDLTEI